MDIIEAIVLGVVQGLTEFLPISSTAHLRVVPAIMGWGDPGAAFTAVVQLGTTFAVILYFWRDLLRILIAWWKSCLDPKMRATVEARQGWAIAIGTLPIGILGVAFKDQIETTFRSLHVISGSLIGLGLLMLVAEKIGSRKKELKDIQPGSGLLFGLWQALALIPGMSRSGSTITGGLLNGFDRAAAAQFSFLLSTPAIIAAAVFSLKGNMSAFLGELLVPTLVAIVAAFISGYWAIGFLMRFLKTKSLFIFVVYRCGLGALLLWLLNSGRLSP